MKRASYCLIALLTLACCSGPRHTAQNIPTPQSATVSPCRSGALSLRHGPVNGAATGERGDIYVLTNSSNGACTLIGYPTVALTDAANVRIPFSFTHRSQYVTQNAPQPLSLRPDDSAFFKVAKYRCDLGTDDIAAQTHVELPDQPGLVLTISTDAQSGTAPGAGEGEIEHCTPGSADPGNRISVSSFAKTVVQTSSG